ncbi:MAG: ECF-type sigma factor [Bryobacter sp.]|nr:ECF-type sigma factor [Bryobacter sp.]
MSDLTTLIDQARAGDTAAEQALYESIYPELRAIARQRLAREAHAPESTESLVHECYLRLKKGGLPEVGDRSHFFALISRIMRQILVDFARARLAGRRDKRREASIESAETVADQKAQRTPGLLELDEHLRELEKVAPEAARLVELRFFGGLTAEESAGLLNMDVGRVRRLLRYGQGWLRRAMQQN